MSSIYHDYCSDILDAILDAHRERRASVVLRLVMLSRLKNVGSLPNPSRPSKIEALGASQSSILVLTISFVNNPTLNHQRGPTLSSSEIMVIGFPATAVLSCGLPIHLDCGKRQVTVACAGTRRQPVEAWPYVDSIFVEITWPGGHVTLDGPESS
jgi:hypothetical protein